MIRAHAFTVAPHIPRRLQDLPRIAHNLHWSWDHDAIELFRRLDPERLLWERCYANPVRMLGVLPQERLEALAADEAFLAHLDRVGNRLTEYLAHPTWFGRSHPGSRLRVAYFCAEFGLVEGLRLYSGGLGILAGDHLKAASELGLPLVGVGLLYRRGYFRQHLDPDGWQQESYPEADYQALPLALERGPDGRPIRIEVEYPGRSVWAQVWRAQVGRLPLFLLDSDLEENAAEDRATTSFLYGGDRDLRIRQEILLGVGGIRALLALGIEPTVCHINEGHAAFLAVERIRQVMRRSGAGFLEAKELVAATNVFTTHTPVPAGIDVFSPEMMERYFTSCGAGLGLDREAFLALGRQDPANPREPFSMAVLALRLSGAVNGVSQLHGRTAQRMWAGLWPEVPPQDLPITSITNGVLVRGWISRDMAGLFDAYLDPRWAADPTDQAVWERVEQIPDAELWRTHERRRERLVAFARRRLRMQLEQRGSSPAERELADEILDPKALTIGFARRFATYKRATLLFRDLDRLHRVLNDPQRPVQIIFSGKAHPADQEGKDFIRRIVHYARQPEFRQRILFLEDYDMKVGRYLYQGVDVWLNNPRRPLEASGTSGMKAAMNGAINVSILDGWWDEAYDGENGWAIGRREVYEDPEYQDQAESQAIYRALESEIAPMFYTRGRDDLPREWIRRMKRSIRTVCPAFSATRMVREYTERMYLPAGERWERLAADNLARAMALGAWKVRVRGAWGAVTARAVSGETANPLEVGAELAVTAEIALGPLQPEEVSVVLYAGPLTRDGEIQHPVLSPMRVEATLEPGVYRYAGAIRGRETGLHGFRVRILPAHPDLSEPLAMGCLVWG